MCGHRLLGWVARMFVTPADHIAQIVDVCARIARVMNVVRSDRTASWRARRGSRSTPGAGKKPNSEVPSHTVRLNQGLNRTRRMCKTKAFNYHCQSSKASPCYQLTPHIADTS